MTRRLLNSGTYREDVARIAYSDLDWDQLQGAEFVLSGASGMLGSFLVDVLMARNLTDKMDCTIHGLARDQKALSERFQEYEGRSNLKLVPVDVAAGPLDTVITGLSSRSRSTFVIHAASNTHPVAYASDPVGTITTNVQGTWAMLDLAVRTRARRALFVSSVEIYGENRGSGSFRESDLGYIDCNTMRAGYPESKRTGEALCQAFREHWGLDVVIPRLPRVYGPTMRLTDSKALSQFLLRAARGQDVVLKSAGDQYYSYSHVADAVSAILTCLLKGKDGEAYNVADPSCDIALKDLAGLVAAAAGVTVVADVPGDLERSGFSAATRATMDGSKLARLGWRPSYSIPEGVERTVAVLKEILL